MKGEKLRKILKVWPCSPFGTLLEIPFLYLGVLRLSEGMRIRTSRNAYFIANLNPEPEQPPGARPPYPYHPGVAPGDVCGFYFAGIGLPGRSGDPFVCL